MMVLIVEAHPLQVNQAMPELLENTHLEIARLHGIVSHVNNS